LIAQPQPDAFLQDGHQEQQPVEIYAVGRAARQAE
jgi:hypothetical protein